MDSSKSQLDFYVDLVVQLILEDPLHVTSKRSLLRDVSTVKWRSSREGLSFLTKTLPLLGKALDRGLADTIFSLPREFKSSRGKSSIPAFLQAYFKMVFDEGGRLLDEADPIAVKHLRQILFFEYKLEVPYSVEDEARVIGNFIQTEKELEFGRDTETSAIMAAASYIARSVFEDFDPKDILPKHGPGAVASGERLDEKWNFSTLYRGIHQVYPYYEYFIVGGGRELIDRLDWYKSMARLDQGRAKVVLVPKDSRGPRLISCEPLEFQWIQQGLGRKLVGHLESFWMTRGQINFTRQEINQELARASSSSLEWATLDLKDASDRVSVDLVSEVFKHTSLLKYLLGTRTTATILPDGRIQELRKFAPMGSALCFPVEATVFWLLIVAAFARETRLPPAEVGKLVYVYGDDIIVPTRLAELATQTLERFALRVNRAKCCVKGPFRESCGMDAFKGTRVTPHRLRKLFSGKPSDGAAYASYVSLANSLADSGYVRASDAIWKRLERTYGKIPYGTSISSFPCRIVSSPEEAENRNAVLFKKRTHSRYQRVEFLVRYLKSTRLGSKLDGWARLLRYTTTGVGDDPQTIVVPRSIQIRRGWRAVY